MSGVTPVQQHKVNELINYLTAGNKKADAAGRLVLQSAMTKRKNYTSQNLLFYIHINKVQRAV
jgi:hypothetical protein